MSPLLLHLLPPTAQALKVETVSSLILRQLTGENKVRAPNLLPLHARACELLEDFHTVTFQGVSKRINEDARKLAMDALKQSEQRQQLMGGSSS